LQEEEGVVISVQPPDNIQELPAPDKPAGEQFAWVPGYWGWDTDRNGFIWVSGCWRAAPPKMSWVPGYWAKVGKGWKWVSGFWIQAGAGEFEYVKDPPAVPDIEPAGLAPSSDVVWVPGCWYWSHGQYVWRPGYWLQEQPGWIWIPSRYAWTPHGYVFVGGHWDYSLEHRGVLYAPVCFPRTFVPRPGFSISLGIVIDIGLLKVNLFTCPRYSHYYFGDYYDDIYLRVGILPRFSDARRHACYDPIFEHDRWAGRQKDPRWEDNERRNYETRRDNRELRPAVTYHDQESRVMKVKEPQRNNVRLAQPMSDVVSEKKMDQRYEHMDTEVQKKYSKQGSEVQQYREERTRWESRQQPERATQDQAERSGQSNIQNDRRVSESSYPDHVKVPSSPIVGWQGPSRQGDSFPSVPGGENVSRGMPMDDGGHGGGRTRQ